MTVNILHKTCKRCGLEYTTRYGTKYRPFICQGCTDSAAKLAKSVNGEEEYRGVRIVPDPKIRGES